MIVCLPITQNELLYNVILSKNTFLKCSFIQDKDEDGKQGGEIRLPLDCVIKEELLNKGNIHVCVLKA